MDRGRRPPTAVEPVRSSVGEVVPSRAVLTELARGFLMLHDSDPGGAARFAATFVREQATKVGEPTMTLLPRLPQIRRTAWGGPASWSDDEGRRT
ncbi:MAG: hypothetical protein L3K17_08170 [Thermoplasmata archaeon]|nr:hypothetical protein [Thermoplasmata archaeon]